jgi:hypothetical protein
MSDSNYTQSTLPDFDRADLHNALRAQIKRMGVAGEELVDEHREQMALALLTSGINLIPSEYLFDNQFIVSVGVYEAAKRLAEA